MNAPSVLFAIFAGKQQLLLDDAGPLPGEIMIRSGETY